MTTGNTRVRKRDAKRKERDLSRNRGRRPKGVIKDAGGWSQGGTEVAEGGSQRIKKRDGCYYRTEKGAPEGKEYVPLVDVEHERKTLGDDMVQLLCCMGHRNLTNECDP